MTDTDLPPVLAAIGDRHTVSSAVLLIAHFGECVRATSEDRPLPSILDTMKKADRKMDLAEHFDTTLIVMGLTNVSGGKLAMTRFMAAFANVLADQGAELEMILHKMTNPEAEKKVAFSFQADDRTLAEVQKMMEVAGFSS